MGHVVGWRMQYTLDYVPSSCVPPQRRRVFVYRVVFPILSGRRQGPQHAQKGVREGVEMLHRNPQILVLR